MQVYFKCYGLETTSLADGRPGYNIVVWGNKEGIVVAQENEPEGN